MSFPQSVNTVRIWRGDDTVLGGFGLTDVLDVPVDLSTHTFTAQWREDVGDIVAYDLVVNVSQANVGVVSASMPSAVTALIVGRGGWDLQSVDSVGFVRTWITGRTTVDGDYTR